jgi:hypothetical protein
MSKPEQPDQPRPPGHPAQAGRPEQPETWGAPRSKVVTWYDQDATVAGGAGLSGLDFMHALMDGKIPPPPIALLLNMRPTKVDRGLVVFECAPDESVYSPIGLVHGGLVCALADSVTGCAVHTTLEPGVGRARRHPRCPLTSRARDHPDRPAPCFRASSGLKTGPRGPRRRPHARSSGDAVLAPLRRAE